MYRSILASAGFTPGSFKQQLQDDLLANQVRSGLAGTDFATTSELKLNAAVTAELRDVRYLTMPLENFRSEVVVDNEAIAAHACRVVRLVIIIHI